MRWSPATPLGARRPAAGRVPEAPTLPRLSAEGTEAMCPLLQHRPAAAPDDPLTAPPLSPAAPTRLSPKQTLSPAADTWAPRGRGWSPPSVPLATPARSPPARVPAVVELVSLRPALPSVGLLREPSAGTHPRPPRLTGAKPRPVQGLHSTPSPHTPAHCDARQHTRLWSLRRGAPSVPPREAGASWRSLRRAHHAPARLIN